MTLETKILDLIKDGHNLSDDQIVKATDWNELQYNSLDIVEIMLKIEDNFGIEIEDSQAEKLKNYNDLITYLKGKNL